MTYIYERIISGNGRVEDLKMLEDISVLLEGASLCALGMTAQNIVITTLKYFRDEYEAHIHNNSCPALICKPLIYYRILPDKCTGCMLCVKSCPVSAISGEPKKSHIIDQSICTKCGVCMETCPVKFSAIIKKTGKSEEFLV
jgi:ferredoxin